MLFLLTAPRDPSPGQVIGAHLHRNLVAGKNSEEVHPELSGNMRQNDMAVAYINQKHGVGQGFDHCAL